ncbi:MAG: hypothetical protein AAF299_00200 [Pseudomonadota bacterium]
MNAWNFNDAMTIANHNWHWLAAALLLGLIVGWVTCRSADAR